jgi:hypothetical protein
MEGGEGHLRSNVCFRVPDDALGTVVIVRAGEVIEPARGVGLVKGQPDGELPVDASVVDEEDRVKAGDGDLRNVSHAVTEAAGLVVDVVADSSGKISHSSPQLRTTNEKGNLMCPDSSQITIRLCSWGFGSSPLPKCSANDASEN